MRPVAQHRALVTVALPAMPVGVASGIEPWSSVVVSVRGAPAGAARSPRMRTAGMRLAAVPKPGIGSASTCESLDPRVPSGSSSSWTNGVSTPRALTPQPLVSKAARQFDALGGVGAARRLLVHLLVPREVVGVVDVRQVGEVGVGVGPSRQGGDVGLLGGHLDAQVEGLLLGRRDGVVTGWCGDGQGWGDDGQQAG